MPFVMVKCPRCGVEHSWPTEDELCEQCEDEWVAECEEMFNNSLAQ